MKIVLFTPGKLHAVLLNVVEILPCDHYLLLCDLFLYFTDVFVCLVRPITLSLEVTHRYLRQSKVT